jgi:hypothetical protein
MNNALGGRSWQFLILMMLLTGSAVAQSSGLLYPGWGTTMNGNGVYFSVLLREAYQVQTFAEASTITFGGAELDLGPNSTLVIGDPFVLTCGTIVVRAGVAEISDGERSASFAVGESAHSGTAYCIDSLPNAPSAVQNDQSAQSDRRSKYKSIAAPGATSGVLNFDAKVADWPYWAVNGAMLSSSLFAIDLTHKCLAAGACTFVPDAFRERRVMFEAGLPAEVAVSYLSYYLKDRHLRWWFVPAAIAIGGDIIVSAHAAHYDH